MRQRTRDRGQATVELALILPVVVIVLLVALQILVVMRDQVALGGAARAAARRAIVEPDSGRALEAARSVARLDPSRLAVSVGGTPRRGEQVTVLVTYVSVTDVAVVGRFTPDITLTERFVVIVE
mgnify:CR=1 FL=1